MLTCKQATLLASQRLDSTLNWQHRIQLWLHLLLCPRCRRFSRQLQFLQHAWQMASQQPSQEVSLSAASKARIAARLNAAQAELEQSKPR